MATPISPRHTRTKNATQHPGQVLLEGQRKRRTNAQIEEDKRRAREKQAVQDAVAQQGISRIASIEAAMEVEQAVQAMKVKPVKPKPKPVKKKQSAKGAASNLTSESSHEPPAKSIVEGGDNHTMGLGNADTKDIGINCGR
ncbi:hypothetical protein DFH29DRAFT_1002806 [Suillus ampliporus]|nr:hypothetical protein DFH29DRAFT_1002806 [Suillus ampliporus]